MRVNFFLFRYQLNIELIFGVTFDTMTTEESTPKSIWKPILLLLALFVLCIVFFGGEPSEVSPLDDVINESALALPEDKIMEFVVNRLTDMLRIFPQSWSH